VDRTTQLSSRFIVIFFDVYHIYGSVSKTDQLAIGGSKFENPYASYSEAYARDNHRIHGGASNHDASSHHHRRASRDRNACTQSLKPSVQASIIHTPRCRLLLQMLTIFGRVLTSRPAPSSKPGTTFHITRRAKWLNKRKPKAKRQIPPIALLIKQDRPNVHINTESVQCISTVYSICPYKYNQ